MCLLLVGKICRPSVCPVQCTLLVFLDFTLLKLVVNAEVAWQNYNLVLLVDNKTPFLLHCAYMDAGTDDFFARAVL